MLETHTSHILTGSKKKQDVKVAGTCQVVLREEITGLLEKDHSYTLNSFITSTKFLSMACEGSNILPIPDVGDVSNDDDSDNLEMITKVVIVRVLQLDSYKSCLRCKARIESTTPPPSL